MNVHSVHDQDGLFVSLLTGLDFGVVHISHDVEVDGLLYVQM